MTKRRLAIAGASALGRQLKGHAEATGLYDFVGFFDDFAGRAEDVIGKTREIEEAFGGGAFDCLAIGVGYKAMSFRHEVMRRCAGRIPLASVVHRSAVVDPDAVVGEGAVLLACAVLDQRVRLGRNCFLSLASTISHDTIIGDSTYISPKATVCGNCKIGERVFLGAGCVIRDGITICDDAVIGAGAVVVNDVVFPGVYAGNPARQLKG